MIRRRSDVPGMPHSTHSEGGSSGQFGQDHGVVSSIGAEKPPLARQRSW